MRTGVFTAALAAAALLAGSAMAETMHADLTAAAEVPPTASPGKGTATVTVDKATKTVSWTIDYSGLTGPATAAHFHGPAAAGANAGVAVPIPNAGASPIKGQATVTDAQLADLMAGKDYINIHTAKNPGGEIRGWVKP